MTSSHIWPQSIAGLIVLAQARGWSDANLAQLWTLHDLMARLFSGRYRGSGRPFVSHLAGTAVLAMDFTDDVDTILAAYAHAAYAQGEFGRLKSGASDQNRKEIRMTIGQAAEALVYDYDAFDFDHFVTTATDDEVLALSSPIKTVLLLRIANECDDTSDAAVHNQRWRQACATRLEAGARFAKLLGQEAFAQRVAAQQAYLAGLPDIASDASRPKRSITLKNRSLRRKPLLRRLRQITRLMKL